jgi:hypothetical protein
MALGPTQLPAPSQIDDVSLPLVHDVPHTFVPVVSGPAGMGEHVPAPLRLQALQAGHSVELVQHTPSMQVRAVGDCWHSAVDPHIWPAAFPGTQADIRQ